MKHRDNTVTAPATAHDRGPLVELSTGLADLLGANAAVYMTRGDLGTLRDVLTEAATRDTELYNLDDLAARIAAALDAAPREAVA